MKFIRPATLQTLESAKQSRCVLLFRQPAYVKEEGLTRINAKRVPYCLGSGSVRAENFRVNTETQHTHDVYAPVAQEAAQPIRRDERGPILSVEVGNVSAGKLPRGTAERCG